MNGKWRNVTKEDGKWWEQPAERLRVSSKGWYEEVNRCWDSQALCNEPICVVSVSNNCREWYDHNGKCIRGRTIQIFEPEWTYYNTTLTTQIFWRTDGTTLYYTENGGKSWKEDGLSLQSFLTEGDSDSVFLCDSTGKRLEPEKPDMVAWTWKSIPSVVFIVVRKSDNRRCVAYTALSESLSFHVTIPEGELLLVDAATLLRDFIMPDGSPCGEVRKS